jgi:hypothetical protein
MSYLVIILIAFLLMKNNDNNLFNYFNLENIMPLIQTFMGNATTTNSENEGETKAYAENLLNGFLGENNPITALLPLISVFLNSFSSSDDFAPVSDYTAYSDDATSPIKEVFSPELIKSVEDFFNN